MLACGSHSTALPPVGMALACVCNTQAGPSKDGPACTSLGSLPTVASQARCAPFTVLRPVNERGFRAPLELPHEQGRRPCTRPRPSLDG